MSAFCHAKARTFDNRDTSQQEEYLMARIEALSAENKRLKDRLEELEVDKEQ